MKSTRAKTQPRAPRRWRTPPPLIRGSAETLEGMEILREISGETGILLWQSYRNVMFWATAEREERGKLFSADAGRRRLEELLAADTPTDLVDALVAVGRMVGAPEATPGDQVAEACVAVSEWAEKSGYDATSLAFTQAAALAAPRDPELSLAVGQAARRLGENARAETWFRHTIMVSRQTGDWQAYSRAYIALGNMFLLRGNLPAAHRMHIKALRASRRKGLTQTAGMAAHDLFVIATETGRNTQAEEYARLALRAYGSDNPRLPALAHDVAYYWMNRGYFAQVIPVFEALQSRFTSDLVTQMVTSSHIARAAGGAGDRSLFRRYYTETALLVKDAVNEPRTADAMLELALGASSLGEWDRAEQTAARALELAQRFGASKVIVEAEALLDSIRNDRKVERRMVQTPASKATETFAEQLVGLLTATA